MFAIALIEPILITYNCSFQAKQSLAVNKWKQKVSLQFGSLASTDFLHMCGKLLPHMCSQELPTRVVILHAIPAIDGLAVLTH